MPIDYAIRSTLLLALTGAAALLLRRRSSAWRHLIWLAGLVTLLALPLAKALAPQWNAPVMTQSLLAAPVRTVINVTASSARRATRQPSYDDWLLIAWLGGAALLLIRACRAQVLASGLVKRSADGPAGARISDETDVPMVCGLWRPVVVLPLESEHWPAERLESVLRHERMHISRGDTIAQAISHLACALYWPQPLVWLAATALRRTCEQACDDGVLSQGTKPSAYAEHLMEIARALSPAAHSTTALEGGIAMTRTNQLEERISALLNSKRDRRQAGASFAATVAAAAVTVVIALAAVQTPLFAQSGILSGVVRDPSLAVIPRARIDIRSSAGAKVEKPLHEIVHANEAGEFSLDIPDGTYDITITSPGFAKQDHQGVLFESAKAKHMDMILAVGGIRERVDVSSTGGPAIARTMNAPPAPPSRIRVGGNVQAANLTRKVTPIYPATAKMDRVEGTVIMKAIIGKDGSVLSLEQINKMVDSRLAEAALDAVKQWLYRPTLLNGEPIEVITEIEVNFTLTR